MTSGKLLKQLFQSYGRRQDEAFQAVALRIIAEERQKKHHTLAAELERTMMNGAVGATREQHPVDELPKDRERNSILVEVRTPERYLDEMILSKQNREKVERVIREFGSSELLRTHGLRPRTKILLCGPPGCGKSMCADVIASELSLPLLYTRFDAVISSYLGETASNIRKVFDHAARGTWALLFDEFDAIGKSREDPSEHGELKRVVNSFLQILDSFHGESIVIAATNHEGLLDRALWRRFDDIIYFDRPTVGQIKELLRRKLANFPQESVSYSALARQLKGLSHADVERICVNAIRFCIVNDVPQVTSEILRSVAAEERARSAVAEGKRRGRPAQR